MRDLLPMSCNNHSLFMLVGSIKTQLPTLLKGINLEKRLIKNEFELETPW